MSGARAIVSALTVAALLGGRATFAAMVVALAAVALVDLSGLLGRALGRPIIVAAFLPAVALPAAVAVAPETTGWRQISTYVLVGLIGAFVLTLVFGRRSGVVDALGGTLFAGVTIGLGASGLLLLRALPDGFRWAVAFLGLVAAAEAGSSLGEQLRRRESVLLGRADMPAVVAVVVVPAVVVAVVGVLVWLLLSPPVTPTLALLLGAAALVGAVSAGWLERTLAAEAGLAEGARERIGDGLVVGVLAAALFTAPVAFVLAATLA